jgi:GTPase SAR1 family protein
MENLLDKMRENAIDSLKSKIEWRKTTLVEAHEKALAILLGNKCDYTYEQTVSGIVTLKSSLAVMEEHLLQLEPPVVKPVKAKRGRPSKK